MRPRWLPAPKPLIALIFTCWIGAAALANSVVVYPFDSQDPLLGYAIADELAAALASRALVVGPESAPGLLPPLVVEGGFITLDRTIGVDAMFGVAGADLLRSGSGLTLAVTGRVLLFDSGPRLEIALAYQGGSREVQFNADRGRSDRLVTLAASVIGNLLDELAAAASAAPAGPPSGSQVMRDLELRGRFSGGFNGAYGGYVRAVALMASGLLEDALVELDQVIGQPDVPDRAAALREDAQAVLAGSFDETAGGGDGARATRRALLAIASPRASEQSTLRAFEIMRDLTGLPVAEVWRGVMAASQNDRATAEPALAAAAPELSYARAVYASFLQTRGAAGYADELATIIAMGPGAESAALLGASVVANLAEDVASEKAALRHLTRAAPFLAYPFERLSYIAFDEDDGLAAAEALVVAVELEPDSDLFWTNLGWAYYLIGFPDRSEQASQRALSLDSTQYIAAFNLGLARTVTGRLDEAMSAYRQALRFDPMVDDEAILDLENAVMRYPEQVAVHYALAYLYEAEGRRADARSSYRRFLRLAEPGAFAAFAADASQRLSELEAPPAPLLVQGGVRPSLGIRGPISAPYHPGDPIYPSFEITTPGDELPRRLLVRAALYPEDGEGEPLVLAERELELAAGTVGYVVEDLEVSLPLDLAAGNYLLLVEAIANDEQRISESTALEVTGEAVALRQLLGRGLVMTALESGSPLYTDSDLRNPDQLGPTLQRELLSTADAAEEALPVIELGRFAGLGGGELFRTSTLDDLRDFLDFMLSTNARSSRFAFVDAYAQWALDGAPQVP